MPVNKMETLKLKAKIDKKGRLKINIPTPLLEGYVEIILIIDSKNNAPQKIKYNFTDLAGKLTWNGDPVKTQRTLRDEW
jgi:hypothetical protein